MCFEYNNNMGSYAQNVEMIPVNSIFETTVDLSEIKAGGVAHITLHRNSYRSLNAPDQN